MRKEQRFTAKDVCAAVQVPHGTLNSWAYKGLFRHLSAAQTTPGKARRFTFRDILVLAIMKQLLDFGFGANFAVAWSAECVTALDYQKSETHLWFGPDGTTVRYDDRAPAPSPYVHLQIFPEHIAIEVRRRLGLSSAESDLTATSPSKSRAPRKRPGRRSASS